MMIVGLEQWGMIEQWGIGGVTGAIDREIIEIL